MSWKRYVWLPCLLLASCSLFDPPATKPTSRPKKSPPSQPATDEGDWVVPRNLFEAFERDPKGADKEYSNKLLRVESTVQTTGVQDGQPYVDMYLPSPGGQPPPLRCLFDAAAQAQVADVKGGGNITIRGRCLGVVGEHITLDGCTIMRYRPPKY